MEKNTLVKSFLGMDIVKTELDNIAVTNGKKNFKKNVRVVYFYGEHAVDEAEQYIMKLHQQGEI